MTKLIKVMGMSLFLVLALCSLSFAQEESITITTYYPSPYGSYNELTTHSNTYLATEGGSVGIGTTGPREKLEVNGHIAMGDNWVRGRFLDLKLGAGHESPGFHLKQGGAMWVFSSNLPAGLPTKVLLQIADDRIGPAYPPVLSVFGRTALDILQVNNASTATERALRIGTYGPAGCSPADQNIINIGQNRQCIASISDLTMSVGSPGNAELQSARCWYDSGTGWMKAYLRETDCDDSVQLQCAYICLN